MQNINDDIQLSKELLEKRTVDLTGEDIYIIVIAAINSTNAPMTEPQKPVKLIRGYKALSKFLQCSVPTACRMVTRKDITPPAVIRRGKTLLFNTDLVIEQLSEVESKWSKRKTK
jgi:hypothetical protein